MLSLWAHVVIGLFVIAILTVVNIGTRNMIILLLSFELWFFAISLACIVYYFAGEGLHWNHDLLFMAISVTVVAAAETAIALALLTRIYKQTKNVRVRRSNKRFFWKRK